MGCGCNKKGLKPTRTALRPTIRLQSAQGGQPPVTNLAEVRALGITQNISPGETRRMDDQRQRLEKMRREAIKKRLNK